MKDTFQLSETEIRSLETLLEKNNLSNDEETVLRPTLHQGCGFTCEGDCSGSCLSSCTQSCKGSCTSNYW